MSKRQERQQAKYEKVKARSQEAIAANERKHEHPHGGLQSVQKKPEEKPANAPTLRRPGEQPEYPQGSNMPPTAYPPPVSTTPNDSPGATPPHWQVAGL